MGQTKAVLDLLYGGESKQSNNRWLKIGMGRDEHLLWGMTN